MDHIIFTAYNHVECIWNRICEYGYVDINYMAACHVRLKHVICMLLLTESMLLILCVFFFYGAIFLLLYIENNSEK